jgi:hypothetical protein
MPTEAQVTCSPAKPISAFHGRGFFQPVQSPGDKVAILAAIEAVFGPFIEISFIATFTQRFFGTK